MTGKVGEPILIGLFVFLQGMLLKYGPLYIFADFATLILALMIPYYYFCKIAAVVSTFIRFFPEVKARYDYGLLIFILTFCLVSISGFRTDEILELAQRRLSTIFIGASTCVIVSIFVFPVWSGVDLHNLVADHIEKLGNFLEGICFNYLATLKKRKKEKSINSKLIGMCGPSFLGFGEEYFEGSGEAEKNDGKSFLAGYKSVLNSKSTEENLVSRNFAANI